MAKNKDSYIVEYSTEGDSYSAAQLAPLLLAVLAFFTIVTIIHNCF